MVLRNEHASMPQLTRVARAQVEGWGSRGCKELRLLHVLSLERGGSPFQVILTTY